MQQNSKDTFDKIHAKQIPTMMVPHRPKTGHYVETHGCFNAATTNVVRTAQKAG